MDWFIFYLIRGIAVTMMAYSFYFAIKDKRLFPSIMLILVGCIFLDFIIALEGIRP